MSIDIKDIPQPTDEQPYNEISKSPQLTEIQKQVMQKYPHAFAEYVATISDNQTETVLITLPEPNTIDHFADAAFKQEIGIVLPSGEIVLANVLGQLGPELLEGQNEIDKSAWYGFNFAGETVDKITDKMRSSRYFQEFIRTVCSARWADDKIHQAQELINIPGRTDKEKPLVCISRQVEGNLLCGTQVRFNRLAESASQSWTKKLEEERAVE